MYAFLFARAAGSYQQKQTSLKTQNLAIRIDGDGFPLSKEEMLCKSITPQSQRILQGRAAWSA